jgi:hypothetical protein
MSPLESPQAQPSRQDACLPLSVAQDADRLGGFFQRYLPMFYRQGQRELAGRQRKPVQHVVGVGKWDDNRS